MTQRQILDAAWVFVFGLLLFQATGNYTETQVNDVAAAGIPGWSLAENHSPYLDSWAADANPWFFEAEGKLVSNRLAGPVLTGAAAYALLGTPHSGDPSWPVPVYPSVFAAAATTAAAAAAMFLVLRQLTGRREALIGTAVLVLGTSTWTVSADGLWPHGPAQLGLAVGLLGLSTGRYLVGGLGYGYAILSRPHLAFVPLVTGLTESVRQRRILPSLLTGIGSVVGVVVLLAYNKWTFGQFSVVVGYAQSGFDFSGQNASEFLVNILGTLVSPERGLFVLSPFLLLLMPGLRAAWKVAPVWVRSSSIGGAIYMLVQLALNRFSGGDGFFGYRLPLELITASAPLLILAYREWTSQTKTRRRLFSIAAWLSLVTHALGASIYDHLRDLRQGEWNPWTTYHPALVVSEAPLLAASLVLVVTAAYLSVLVLPHRRATETPDQEPALEGQTA